MKDVSCPFLFSPFFFGQRPCSQSLRTFPSRTTTAPTTTMVIILWRWEKEEEKNKREKERKKKKKKRERKKERQRNDKKYEQPKMQRDWSSLESVTGGRCRLRLPFRDDWWWTTKRWCMSYQSGTQVIKSQVTVRVTVPDVTRHFMVEEEWVKIKLNEPRKQKLAQQNPRQ